jgi:hypothetical protein
VGVFTLTGGFDWQQIPYAGPYLLFLRQSRGDETQIMPGLRPTGGGGLQGFFVLQSGYDFNCTGVVPANTAKCTAALDVSQEPVKIRYRRDPLKTTYEGIPASSFLKEVQSLADSSGNAAPAPGSK